MKFLEECVFRKGYVMKKWSLVSLGLLALASFSLGCSQEAETKTPSVAVDSSKYLLTSEPEGAQDVIAVRESAQDQDEVVVVGRIGGSENPWIDGRTAFTIVDPSLQACSDIPGDQCEKPWDYCCATDKLPGATALIKVVDENGDLIKADAREALKLTELQTVVVKGKASRDENGNLTVLANSLYVRS